MFSGYGGRSLTQDVIREVLMPELSEAHAAVNDPLSADISVRLAQSNKHIVDILLGTQRIILEEAVFTSNEVLDRAKTETHLLTEFLSKMAGAHSVNGVRTMLEECGQHQIDFIRRDCERLYKHGQRMIEANLNLISQHRQS
jgi:hypothetical protein